MAGWGWLPPTHESLVPGAIKVYNVPTPSPKMLGETTSQLFAA